LRIWILFCDEFNFMAMKRLRRESRCRV
jgi:hypothetical protein